MSKAAMVKQEMDWRGESDHRTLRDAAEIQGDPDRMKGVAKQHRKQKRALAGVGRVLGSKR